MKIAKLALLTGILISTADASAGGKEGGNGGFAYKRSIEVLRLAQADVRSWMLENSKIEDCVNGKLVRESLKPVSFQKFVTHLENIKKSYVKTKLGIDADGEEQPLMFSYGRDSGGNNFIEALQPYFIAFMRPSHQYEESNGPDGGDIREVGDLLIHEASHLQGYTEIEANKLDKIFGWRALEKIGSVVGECGGRPRLPR